MPCIVDLATMREAVADLGGDPNKINPLAPAEMVIDHSVIADLFGTENALERNVDIEYERNGERYQFLRWGQTAFDDFKVVPPGTGIVHQVNIEYLARVVMAPRRASGLPRHLRRHRLAHHDGQRPRRARLGRRRHRGRGGHARPARLDAHPQGRRLQADRRDPDRRDRDRRRAHHHRDAAQARRGRQVRRVLRRGRRRGAAGQPRHHRQHEPRVRLDRRHVPDRRRHARLPAPHRPQRRAGRARRGVRQAAGALARPASTSRSSASTSSSTSSTVVPSIAGPKRPQDRIELVRRQDAFRKDLDDYADEHARRHPRRELDEASRSRSRPPIRPSISPADEDADRTWRHHHSHGCRRQAVASRPRSRPPSTATSRSTTAPSRSPRSPRARTRRTRR